MNRHERRISKLEQRARARERIFVWREPGQTDGHATAARFPEGEPAGVEVVVIGWEEEPHGEGEQVSIAGMKPIDGGEYGRNW